MFLVFSVAAISHQGKKVAPGSITSRINETLNWETESEWLDPGRFSSATAEDSMQVSSSASPRSVWKERRREAVSRVPWKESEDLIAVTPTSALT